MRPGDTQAPIGQEPFYFFLSHAHPQPVDPDIELDYYERAVFEDLSNAVSERPREKADWSIGLFRPCADSSAEPGRVGRALATTAVFVALRSQWYDSDAGTAAERSAFLRQSPTTHGRPPQHRLLPILWEVPPGGAAWIAREAALIPLPDVPQYAETGLVALSRRYCDRDAYERVLAFLSEWIVEVAEGRPAAAGTRWSEVPPREARPAFVIAKLGVGPADGPASTAWAPAGDTVADRLHRVTARAAEYVNRTRFDVQATDVSLGDNSLGKRPGVLLVDWEILGTEGGRSRLRQMLRALPAWVQPLIVPDDVDAVHPPDADLWDARQALAAAPRRVPRPRIKTEPDDPAAVIATAIDRATRHFDDRHLLERQYPPRPRSNSHPEE